RWAIGGDRVGGPEVGGTVRHEPNGPLGTALAEEHDRAAEVRVAELRHRQEQRWRERSVGHAGCFTGAGGFVNQAGYALVTRWSSGRRPPPSAGAAARARGTKRLARITAATSSSPQASGAGGPAAEGAARAGGGPRGGGAA